MEVRSTLQRKEHVLKKLQHDRDVWVATANDKGFAHLIPMSLYWDGTYVIVTTPKSSITTRNVMKSSQARLALDDTRDVVLIDVSVKVSKVDSKNDELSERFKSRNGWDPREASSEYVYFFMSPERIQVWENEEELAGRVVMKRGEWLA
jgi:general stress protein 26